MAERPLIIWWDDTTYTCTVDGAGFSFFDILGILSYATEKVQEMMPDHVAEEVDDG